MELTMVFSLLHRIVIVPTPQDEKHGPDIAAVSSSSDPATAHGDMKNNELPVYSYVSKKLDNIDKLLDKLEAL
uniref:Uncharacterized protein n=1 Tax=Oryza punctata TaxID=4537 RepID=A0A0E0M106_ORYPU